MTMPDPSLDGSMSSFPSIARTVMRGSRMATVISAFAFAFSAVSFYETVMKQPKLDVFVPPVIHYARDSGGDVELFAVPVTIANEGARTGTVISMQLEVEAMKPAANAPASKRYYAAYLGEHPAVDTGTPGRAFAPLSIAGRTSFTDTVRFYPIGNPLPKLVDDAGDYRFTLTVETGLPSKPDLADRLLRKPPQPLVFERTLPWISEQQLGHQRLAIPMHLKEWKPAAGAANTR